MATVLVPWRGGDVHRERAWRWVRARWLAAGFDPLLCFAPPGPWCKADAVMPLVPECDEVVILADADCWTEGVAAAVDAAETGAAWAIPHTKLHRLTPNATAAVLAGADPAEHREEVERPAYDGILGGGMMAVRREALLRVPIDRRFIGWGREDCAWREAMLTFFGKPWRGKARLFHLWHPPQSDLGQRREVSRRPVSEALFECYCAARGNPDLMAALLEEIRPSTSPNPRSPA